MGYDTPEQAFIVFGNLNWSVILVAGHQPDLPVVAQFNVFHGETLGSDAYGKVSPLGFEHPVYNHRIAVLDVVVNQGEALYLSEEGADRVGNQLFVQVDKPLGGNIALRKKRSSDRPPLEQRGLFLLRQAVDKACAPSLEPPDFDDDRNDAQHPRFGFAVDRKRVVRSAAEKP